MIDLYGVTTDSLLPILPKTAEIVRVDGKPRTRNQSVEIRYRDMVVRVYRDKLYFGLAFRSIADVNEWFDASVVLLFAGLASDPVFDGSTDANVYVTRVEELLRHEHERLANVFSDGSYPGNKEQLDRLQYAVTQSFLRNLRRRAIRVRQQRQDRFETPRPAPHAEQIDDSSALGSPLS